jgi:hypothetical protein
VNGFGDRDRGFPLAAGGCVDDDVVRAGGTDGVHRCLADSHAVDPLRQPRSPYVIVDGGGVTVRVVTSPDCKSLPHGVMASVRFATAACGVGEHDLMAVVHRGARPPS